MAPKTKPLFKLPEYAKVDSAPRTPTAARGNPRETFIEAVHLQQKLFAEPEWQPEGKQRAPHKWWWQGKDGSYRVTIKYGSHVLSVIPNMPNVEVGKIENVPKFLAFIEEQAEHGVLDDVLHELASKTGRRLQAARQ